MNSRNDKTKGTIYQIRIKGHLDSQWSQWFDNFTIIPDKDGNSTLTGTEEDESALYGLLKKIRDSGMSLLSLNIIKDLKEE